MSQSVEQLHHEMWEIPVEYLELKPLHKLARAIPDTMPDIVRWVTTAGHGPLEDERFNVLYARTTQLLHDDNLSADVDAIGDWYSYVESCESRPLEIMDRFRATTTVSPDASVALSKLVIIFSGLRLQADHGPQPV